MSHLWHFPLLLIHPINFHHEKPCFLFHISSSTPLSADGFLTCACGSPSTAASETCYAQRHLPLRDSKLPLHICEADIRGFSLISTYHILSTRHLRKALVAGTAALSAQNESSTSISRSIQPQLPSRICDSMSTTLTSSKSLQPHQESLIVPLAVSLASTSFLPPQCSPLVRITFSPHSFSTQSSSSTASTLSSRDSFRPLSSPSLLLLQRNLRPTRRVGRRRTTLTWMCTRQSHFAGAIRW